MPQKDQIFAYWAQQLGYLTNSQVQKWQQRTISFEQYIRETSLLKSFQLKSIQLLFIRHCLWSEIQKQNLITAKKVQELLADTVYNFQQGEIGTHFTELEKRHLNLSVVQQIASAYYQQKVFSDNDYQTFEQMFQEARISMSAASINLEETANNQPIPNLYQQNLQAGEKDQTLQKLDLLDINPNIQQGIPNLQKEAKYFGPYEILHEIGAGGMGKVYKARDTKLDKVIAVKVMLNDKNISEKEKERFTTEAQVMAKLQHSNIIQVLSVGQEGAKHYIAMDFVQGESLAKLLKRESFTPKRCLQIIFQICEAMGYAHQQNIIHRDLKPSNIIIREDGQALVMDFGLAKRVDGGKKLTKSGELLGTPQYMSPEQAGGETKKFRSTTDVYAIGTIMYEMLTGQASVDGNSTYDIIFSILNKEVTPPRQIKPKIARDLETICLKALEKDPERRYNNASLFADDIKRYLDGEAIEAKRASIFYLCRKKIWRNKLLVASLAIVVGVILALNHMLWHNEQTKKAKAQEKAWISWWEDFIHVHQKDKERIIQYQKELAEASKLLKRLKKQFKKWQKISRNDMLQEIPIIFRYKWDKLDIAYKKHKDQMKKLRRQSRNNNSIVDNLISFANRHKELSLKSPPIPHIHKKMEQQLLATTFENVQQSYELRTQKKESYNPAQIMQEVIYHLYLKDYIQKNRQVIRKYKSTTKQLLNRERKSEKKFDLTIFEQQKVFLSYVLLFDPDVKLIKRYNQNFSLESYLRRLRQISQTKYNSILEQLIQKQSPTIEELDYFRYKLHEICLIDTDFASPYYRIGRLLQQVKSRHRSANWYFLKSLQKSKKPIFSSIFSYQQSIRNIFARYAKAYNFYIW